MFLDTPKRYYWLLFLGSRKRGHYGGHMSTDRTITEGRHSSFLLFPLTYDRQNVGVLPSTTIKKNSYMLLFHLKCDYIFP